MLARCCLCSCQIDVADKKYEIVFADQLGTTTFLVCEDCYSEALNNMWTSVRAEDKERGKQ